MSILIAMIEANVPLHSWRTFDATRNTARGGSGFDFGKKIDRFAQVIVSSLSHPDAVELVANEFNNLPHTVRLRVTQLANEQHGNVSGNKTKGVTRLDRLLDGRLLSSVVTGPTFRKLEVVNGYLRSVQQVVRPEVAGAMQTFAAFREPEDYASWAPARKRAYREQMARERRKAKG